MSSSSASVYALQKQDGKKLSTATETLHSF